MGRLNAGIIQVTPFQQNCTILYDEDTKAGVIVDPGGDVDILERAIKENGFNIEAIWLRVSVEASRPKPVEAPLKISAARASVAKLPVTGTPNRVTAIRHISRKFSMASTT